jgi:hypothetical protein
VKKEQIPAVMSLTREHWRLLYLISLYSSPSISLDNKDRWIRKLSLQVFMYEGIVKKVFDWDLRSSGAGSCEFNENING